jgi:D-alanyl-D-alanine carboxypeptidase/D-alanyl-D-alanine-endopeptidase (penicillin-binding protein 4)
MNAVSAQFLTDLLMYMDKKGVKSGAFYQSLPVAGKEGTVVSFLKGTPLASKARFKTGSMTNVQAYAGYIEKGDKRYAVAIIINNFTDKRAQLKKDIEQLLLSLLPLQSNQYQKSQ